MINFRYHIVSLMAVFIALAVGIAVGVSLSPSVSQGLQQQAAQDRQAVTDLRAEVTRRQALDDYRNAYDERTGKIVTAGVLNGTRVAMVAMPDAPTSVVQSISTAVKDAGGTVVRDVKISDSAFDPAKTTDVSKALAPYAAELQLTDSMTQPTKIGIALARSVVDRASSTRNDQAVKIGDALTGAGLVSLSKGTQAQANLAIIVTAEAAAAADHRPTAEVQAAHLQLDLAVQSSAAVVLAGPNSADIEGTDVLAARTDGTAAGRLSTVDVADLSSGAITVVLTGKEQLNGTVGQHYGALSRADAPLPELPLR
jgi:hypothetical protein